MRDTQPGIESNQKVMKARELKAAVNDVSPIPRVYSPSVHSPQPAAAVMTNYEKSEDRLSENVEGVKKAKIMKARDTLDVALYCWRSQRPA